VPEKKASVLETKPRCHVFCGGLYARGALSNIALSKQNPAHDNSGNELASATRAGAPSLAS
jgi:hypothetical protein